MDSLTVFTTEEQAALDRNEAIISLGLNTFHKVGNALMDIRDNRLYRQNYATFDDYCEARWGIHRARAYQLMDATQTYDLIKTSTIVDILPQNEGQLRPLAGLEPEQKVTAYAVAATSASKVPTGKQVAQAARVYKPTNGSKPKPPTTTLESTAPASPQPASVTPEVTAPALKPVKLDGVTKEQVDKAFSLLRLFVVSGYKEFFVNEARKLLKETGKL